MDEETKYIIQMFCERDGEWSNFYQGEGYDFKGNFSEEELPLARQILTNLCSQFPNHFRIVKVTTSVVESITLVIQSEGTKK